jgi:WD40 repeat protein
MTGEVEVELKGHTGEVKSVAFSQDGSEVVSGSCDKTVRIWDTMTGGVKALLLKCKGNLSDGSRFISHSRDGALAVGMQNMDHMVMRDVEAEADKLKGNTSDVISVAFSQDGSQVVCGLNDKKVWIWNTMTGNLQLMTTTMTTITLPDASIVHNAGEGVFHICYPQLVMITGDPRAFFWSPAPVPANTRTRATGTGIPYSWATGLLLRVSIIQ